jgi:hypothetical protein
MGGLEPLKRILTQTMKSAPISKELGIARVFEAFRTVMVLRWGEEKAEYVIPVSLKEGVLKLESRSPAAIQEFRLIEAAVKNDLNRQIGEALVGKILIVSRGY